MLYDIFSTREESLKIETMAGKITSTRKKDITKKGLRIFEHNKIFQNSYVGNIPDQELITLSEKQSCVGLPYEYSLAPMKNLDISDKASLNTTLEQVYSWAEEANHMLAEFSDHLSFTGELSRHSYWQTLKGDHGEGKTSEMVRCFSVDDWGYMFSEKGSGKILDGYFGEHARRANVKEIIATYSPYLAAFSKLVSFEKGRYPVLFVDDGILFQQLCESLKADKYCTGSALYSGKLNTQIASPQLSLYDVNYSPEHGIYRTFDNEGTVRQLSKLPLIENGIFKQVISDLRTSKKFQVEATGNGQRSFDSSVSINFNGRALGSGKRSWQTILHSLPQCIVVLMAHGGDFNDQGNFSTPLHLAYMVRHGEIIGRLPQLTACSSTQEMFGNRLIEVASDSFEKSRLSPNLFIEMDVLQN